MYTLILGDSAEKLKEIDSNSISALITDPPAGISFMGKEWDSNKGNPTNWINWLSGIMRECLRVMKPGAYGLVWALPKISHRTAIACEMAGFTIRDKIYHLFGSGFPKSLSIGKQIDKQKGIKREVIGIDKSKYRNAENYKGGKYNKMRQTDYDSKMQITIPTTEAAKKWEGWGTALKPCIEEWILIQKPIDQKTIADNVLVWGVGGLNIDKCRVSTNEIISANYGSTKDRISMGKFNQEFIGSNTKGRWPAQLIHDGSPEAMAEFAKYGEKTSGGDKAGSIRSLSKKDGNSMTMNKANNFIIQEDRLSNSGSIARFFYCAKSASSEKNEGLEDLINDHCTVKSIALMKYLITLITPPGETILDPFAGSGSTIVAAEKLMYDSIGIEMDKNYFEIMKARVEYVAKYENSLRF